MKSKIIIVLMSCFISKGYCCDLNTVERAWEKIDSVNNEETDIPSIVRNAEKYLTICGPVIQDKECLKRSVLRDDFKLTELTYLISFCESNKRLLEEI